MGKITVLEEMAMGKAAAKLPKGTKMPDPKIDLGKPEDELIKSIAIFQKTRDELEKKLADVQNACGKLKTAIKQESAYWAAQKFGLSGDDKSAKDASKIICDNLDMIGDKVDKAIKSFDDLETTIEKIDGSDLLPWIK